MALLAPDRISDERIVKYIRTNEKVTTAMVAAKFGMKQHVAYDRLTDTEGITKYREHRKMWWKLQEQSQ